MSENNHASEPFGNIPNASEGFRTVPNESETFRTIPKPSERKESHTLTVREVARMFQAAGVARTERSVTNWCHPNKMGVSRFDAYFDPNEKKFFITPQSVELAIMEEQAKAAKSTSSEAGRTVPNRAESDREMPPSNTETEGEGMKVLKQEIMDLKIMNRGKDFFIEQLQKEREGFALERKEYVDKLMTFNRQIGELEIKLLQLESPKNAMQGEASASA